MEALTGDAFPAEWLGEEEEEGGGADAEQAILEVEDEAAGEAEEAEEEVAPEAEEGAADGEEEAAAEVEEEAADAPVAEEVAAEAEGAEEDGQQATQGGAEEEPAEEFVEVDVEVAPVAAKGASSAGGKPARQAPTDAMVPHRRGPDLEQLLKSIVKLNKQDLWPGYTVGVHALKALRTVPHVQAFKILREVEELRWHVDDPSEHILEAVRQGPGEDEVKGPPSKRRKRRAATTAGAEGGSGHAGAAADGAAAGGDRADAQRRRQAREAEVEAGDAEAEDVFVEVEAEAEVPKQEGAAMAWEGKGKKGGSKGNGVKGDREGKGGKRGKGHGGKKGKKSREEPVTREMVANKIQQLTDWGIELDIAAVTALFKVTEQIAMAVLSEAGDRGLVQNASKFVLQAVAREEQRAKGKLDTVTPGGLPNPELFKMRFAKALKEEDARKGGKKGKGKGKGKGKDEGKGKSKDSGK